MATTTTNLALTKSAGSENYSIDIVNANLDKIDAGCVNVSQAQTITGDKTFAPSSTGVVTCVAEGNQNNKRPIYRVKMTSLPNGSNPASSIWSGLQFTDANNAEVGAVTFNRETTGLSHIHLFVKDTSGTTTSFKVINDGSVAYVTAPWRGANNYASMGTGEVITKGALQASTDVVHTSGNETISGIKSLKEFVNYGYQIIPLTANTWTIFCKTQNATNYHDRNLLIALLPRHSETGIQLVNLGTRYNLKSTLFNRLTSNSDNRYAFGVIFTGTEITWYVKSSSEAQIAIYPIVTNYLGSVMNNAITDHYETGYKFCIYAESTTLTDADMSYTYTA